MMAYLHGLEYLPRGCQPEVLAAHLCRTHDPDIVLCSRSIPTTDIPCNQRISFGSHREMLIAGDTIMLSEKFERADIEAVFQVLLE